MKRFRRLWLAIAFAMTLMSVFVVKMSAQSVTVPQDKPSASVLYNVPESALFPVANPGGFVIGWKIEAATPMTITTPSGACVDYVTTNGRPAGAGTVQRSLIEDWSRWQVSGTNSYLVANAATVYMGTCGLITEVGATITGTVIAEPSLNVRRGPAITYPKFGSLSNGQAIIVQARNSAGTWFYAITSVHMGGWVSGQYLNISGDKMLLPVIEALSPKSPPVVPLMASPNG